MFLQYLKKIKENNKNKKNTRSQNRVLLLLSIR